MLTNKGGRPIIRSRTMLGTFLRDRRKTLLKVSVAEMAERTGLTASAIYMIERGDRADLRADTLVKLAGGYSVVVNDLIDQLNGKEPQPA